MSDSLPPLELELAQLEIMAGYPDALMRLRHGPAGWWLNVLLTDPPQGLFLCVRCCAAEQYPFRIGIADEHDRIDHIPEMLIPSRAAAVAWVIGALKDETSNRRAGTVAASDLLLLPRDSKEP